MTQELAPIIVVTGSEELLVERAVRAIVTEASSDEAPELVELDAASLEPGKLNEKTSPTLFGGRPLVVLQGIEDLVQSKPELADAIEQILGYLKAPSPDASLVLVHGGGNGGKPILTAAKKAGAEVTSTPVLKKAGEIRNHRTQFVLAEFKGAGCTISRRGADALIEAVGTGLRDLAAACAQLVSDRGESHQIDENDVARYYGGVAEVRTFDVADRVLAGHTAEALGLFRHARESGAPIVLFPAALAIKLRQVAIVASAPRGASAASITAATGIPDWNVKNVRETASHWTEAGLIQAIRAVAEADAAIKSDESDKDYALERMLITVGRSRSLTQ